MSDASYHDAARHLELPPKHDGPPRDTLAMPRAALLLVIAGVVLSLPITHRTSGLQCGQAPRRDGAAVLYFHIFKAAGTRAAKG